MVEVRASVDIAAPVDAVVGVLLDATRAPLWTDGLERFEVVRGVPGEAGCVGRATYRGSFGRTVVMTDTLELANPGRFYRSTVSGGGITAVVETRPPTRRMVAPTSISSGPARGRIWPGT